MCKSFRLTFNRCSAMTNPLRHTTHFTSNRKFVKRAIIVSWMIAALIIVTFAALVLLGVAGTGYDPKFGRCAFSSTPNGHIAHLAMRMLFLITPSLITLVLYVRIISCLLKHRRESGRITNKAFITITIVLVLYYVSFLPSLFLRDIPSFWPSIKMPSNITISTSVMYYISTLTDPFVYAIRSQHVFITIKSKWESSRKKPKSEVVNNNNEEYGYDGIMRFNSECNGFERNHGQPLYYIHSENEVQKEDEVIQLDLV